MESSTQFNLEAGIKTWRSDLKGQGSLDSNDLDELENHFRESIEDLESDQLTLEEAFIVAKRRIGRPSDIRAEFQKVNPGRLWSTRVCWMLVGYLSFTLIGNIASLLSKFTVLTSITMGIQSNLANLSGISILAITWILFIGFLAKRCHSIQARGPLPFSEFLSRRPIISALSITMLYLVTHVLSQVTTTYFARTLMGTAGKAVSDFLLTQAFSSLGITCVLLIGSTLAVHKLRRLSN